MLRLHEPHSGQTCMSSLKKEPQIGVSLPRADAWTKVTGRERFAADYYGTDFLWAGVKRSTVPHARLKNINVEEARCHPGVFAVFTHADVPGPNRQGIIKKEQPVLVDQKVRRIGDSLALVLAEDKIALDRALELIEVELEPLPAVFDPIEALERDAPLIHEDCPQGNLLNEIQVQCGDFARGLDDSDVIVEWTFETGRQEHAYLETEAGWAYMDENRDLVIVASTQSPFRDRMEIAAALALEPERIRVISPFLGGGFGGKDGCTVQCLLALAALKSSGRPVKMWWSREESFLAGTKRLPASMHYRLGAKDDGTLHALDCSIIMDTGPYEHLSGEVLALAVEHAGGAYRIPHVRINGRCVYTNNPVGGPFRGFGVPQVTAAIEQMMDMLAFRLNLDPMDIRLRNVVRRGDKSSVGVTLVNSTGGFECLHHIAEHPLWTDRENWKKQAGPFKRRGVGLSSVHQGMGYGPVIPDVGNAKIELTDEGRIRVACGVSDMGQGNATAFLHIAGHILNQHMDDLELITPDTAQTLPSGSSTASRTTYTYANALIGAANGLKQKIFQRVSDLLLAPTTNECALLSGRVRHLPSGREIPLSKLSKILAPFERVSTHYWRAPTAKDSIDIVSNSELMGIPHIVFSYAAHLACVEVDELTGRVEVIHYLAASDCGHVMNPQLFEQQIQGGIAQGLGFALYEDFLVNDGRAVTTDLATYILPTAMDSPDMDSVSANLFESTGPFGLKGAGEIAINGVLPAVANAVADACTVRIARAPLTPEKILEALDSREF